MNTCKILTELINSLVRCCISSKENSKYHTQAIRNAKMDLETFKVGIHRALDNGIIQDTIHSCF